MSEQIVSITIFQYEGFRQKWQALSNMGLLPRKIDQVPGLSFYKLMGSGKKGFSLRPNWGTYALLMVWKNSAAADTYFDSSLFAMQEKQCTSFKTRYLRAYQSKGLWDAQAPFALNGIHKADQPIAVITRATLKLRPLYNFWKHVPSIRRSVMKKDGRLFSIGVGERPFFQQVTFSIWESTQHMEAFAHSGQFHTEAIAEVRKKGMFKEELYARFEVVE